MMSDQELYDTLSAEQIEEVSALLKTGRHSFRSAVEAVKARAALADALENAPDEIDEDEDEED